MLVVVVAASGVVAGVVAVGVGVGVAGAAGLYVVW